MKSRIARDEVNVEVDSATGPELGTILSELRSQYEGIVKRNKEQAEQWYRKKVWGVISSVNHCNNVEWSSQSYTKGHRKHFFASWRWCRMRWRRATRLWGELRESWPRGSASCRPWRWSWRVCTNRWAGMQQQDETAHGHTVNSFSFHSSPTGHVRWFFLPTVLCLLIGVV